MSCRVKVCYSPLNARVIPHQILTPTICLKKTYNTPKAQLRTPCSPFLNGPERVAHPPFPDKLVFILLLIFLMISPRYQPPIRLVLYDVLTIFECQGKKKTHTPQALPVFHSSWDPVPQFRSCKARKIQPKKQHEVDMKLMQGCYGCYGWLLT